MEQLIRKDRSIRKHPPIRIMFQPIKPIVVHDQQVVRIFGGHMPRAPDVNRTGSGRKEVLAIPPVQILEGTYPDSSVRIRKDVFYIEFGDPLRRAEVLESGTKKPVDAVLSAHPQKSRAVDRQRPHRKIFESFSLPKGAKNIFLRVHTGHKRQQTCNNPYCSEAETRQADLAYDKRQFKIGFHRFYRQLSQK